MPTPRHAVQDERPEPVLDAAAVVRTLGLVTGALVLALGVAGVIVPAELVARITAATTAVVGASYAVWALLVPLRRAWAVRAQVTPVSSPRAADGTELVRVDGQPIPRPR